MPFLFANHVLPKLATDTLVNHSLELSISDRSGCGCWCGLCADAATRGRWDLCLNTVNSCLCPDSGHHPPLRYLRNLGLIVSIKLQSTPMGHSFWSWLSSQSASRTLSNLTPGWELDDAISLISAASALGLRGRIRGDKKDGGSRGVGASSSAGQLIPQDASGSRYATLVYVSSSSIGSGYNSGDRGAMLQ
ncbi:hypothetical protein Tco_0575425 [Tanacetum coccineum]